MQTFGGLPILSYKFKIHFVFISLKCVFVSIFASRNVAMQGFGCLQGLLRNI